MLPIVRTVHKTAARLGLTQFTRPFSNLILKEIASKNEMTQEMAMYNTPESYRYLNISAEDKKLMAGDWKALSPEKVRDLYDKHFQHDLAYQLIYTPNLASGRHLVVVLLTFAFLGYTLKDPLLFFICTTFYGHDEYMRFVDHDFFFACEMDKYAQDDGIIFIRARTHPYKIDPELLPKDK